MIKTETGRVSRTQMLQIASTMLQSVNVGAFVAFGLPAEYVAAGAMFVTMLQSGIGMYLRFITNEPMK